MGWGAVGEKGCEMKIKCRQGKAVKVVGRKKKIEISQGLGLSTQTILNKSDLGHKQEIKFCVYISICI